MGQLHVLIKAPAGGEVAGSGPACLRGGGGWKTLLVWIAAFAAFCIACDINPFTLLF